MARCNSCNKFVSYGDPEIEIDSLELHNDESGGTVSVSAEVRLTCGDCGDALKSACIEVEKDFEHSCDPEVKAAFEKQQKEAGEQPFDEESGTEFTIEDESPDCEPTDRRETHDRNGKPIKNARYQRQFYGFSTTVDLLCNKCGEIIQLDIEGEEQASGFGEY